MGGGPLVQLSMGWKERAKLLSWAQLQSSSDVGTRQATTTTSSRMICRGRAAHRTRFRKLLHQDGGSSSSEWEETDPAALRDLLNTRRHKEVEMLRCKNQVNKRNDICCVAFSKTVDSHLQFLSKQAFIFIGWNHFSMHIMIFGNTLAGQA